MEDVATLPPSLISNQQDVTNIIPDSTSPVTKTPTTNNIQNGREKDIENRNRKYVLLCSSTLLVQARALTVNSNNSLDILNAYIQRQRSLLERIKLDIERLKETKQDIDSDPVQALDNILDPTKNDDTLTEEVASKQTDRHVVKKLSELIHQVIGDASVTNDLDWELFRGHGPYRILSFNHQYMLILKIPNLPDPTSIHSLPFYPSLPTQHIPIPTTPNTPNPILIKPTLSSFIFPDKCWQPPPSSSNPSPLSLLVRQKRAEWIEPALVEAQKYLETFPSDSDDECTKSARPKDAPNRERKEQRRGRGRESRADGGSSARRKKSDGASTNALARPRGFGGRFKKLDQTNSSDVAANSVNNITDNIQDTSPTLSNWHGSSLPTPSTSAAYSPEIDVHNYANSGRSQRRRRPSTRYGSPTPSAVSAVSGCGGSRSRRGGSRSGWRSSVSASPAPEPPRVRLTIRIPPRSAFKGSRGSVPTGNGTGNGNDHMHNNGSELVSASTSLMTSTSHTRSVSMGGSVNGDYGEIGFHRQNSGSGAIFGAGANGSNTDSYLEECYSPETMTGSAGLSFVKKEEEEGEMGLGDDMDVDFAMDVDMDRRANRFKHHRQHSNKAGEEEIRDKSMVLGLEDDKAIYSDQDDEDDPETTLLGIDYSYPRRAQSRNTHNDAGRNGERVNGNAKKQDTTTPSNQAASSSPTTSSATPLTRRGDKASRTYNQSWSEAEQRQLDVLLEQFPDGTKNRWSNISKAMGGTRTPRQVASRVQKYFLKMRKFGVDIS